ncbi:glycosyltransferase family 2 protein [Photorhabdus tasmaniensis]|nr:glycosyltransferase family 2 protein [Photorhabdus tasmaniensis]
MSNNPEISLLMVARNSENSILNALRSYTKQTFRNSEIIFVDGLSTDKTKKLAVEFLSQQELPFQILDNPKKNLAAGWNIAIREAKGKYILRIDAHATIEKDYVSLALASLENISSLNVAGIGGVLRNKSTSNFGKYVMDFYCCPFGVGNSPFRIKSSGVKETDTAVFAIYNKEICIKNNLFNENLKRNQDIEFHKKLIKAGYSLYTNYNMVSNYFVRSTFTQFCKKAFSDGEWVIRSKNFYLRHIIPLLFTLYMVFLSALLIFFSEEESILLLYLVPLIVYILSCLIFSLQYSKQHMFKKLGLMPLFFSYHISYGFGSIIGITKLLNY